MCRAELVGLEVDRIQQGEGRWVIPDLVGKGSRLRTVTIPAAAKVRIDTWIAAAKIDEGKVFRPVNKGDRVAGEFIADEKAIWQLVVHYARALYSRNRMVPTYTKSQITSLRNNYNGATPDPSYIPEWRLTLDGLTSGLSVSLNIRNLLGSFKMHEQITRLVCVEGWSAIAWWAGFSFDDLLGAYPPMSQAKWARLESSVNLGPWRNRPILRVARSVDGSSSPDLTRDSPERKASHTGARSPAATACTCETRSEEHQGDHADYLYARRASGLLGKARVFTL